MPQPHEILSTVTLGELVASKTSIITVRNDQPLAEVVGIFHKNNILSAPVRDQSGSIIGIVDMFQIMTAVVFGGFFKTGVLDDQVFEKSSFEKLNAADVLGLSEEGKSVWIYNPEEPLEKVVEVFTKGVHRVLVRQRDDAGTPTVRVLSQTDVVQYVSKRLGEVAETSEKPLNELGLATFTSVKTVDSSKQTLLAYRQMVQDDLLALPVVDSNGSLLGNLSSSDLRGLTIENAKSVLSPVSEFLNLGTRPVISCKATTSLKNVVEQLLNNKVHRVWIVDDESKVVGVVTLTDLITKFSPYDHKRSFIQ